MTTPARPESAARRLAAHAGALALGARATEKKPTATLRGRRVQRIGFATTVLAAAATGKPLAPAPILGRVGEEEADHRLQAGCADRAHLRGHDPLQLAAAHDLAILGGRGEQPGVGQQLGEQVRAASMGTG